MVGSISKSTELKLSKAAMEVFNSDKFRSWQWTPREISIVKYGLANGNGTTAIGKVLNLEGYKKSYDQVDNMIRKIKAEQEAK